MSQSPGPEPRDSQPAGTPTALLLRRARAGEADVAQELVPVVYHQLRALARRLLADQRQATLQPTELIHEAYLRLADPEGSGLEVQDKRHFQRIAAQAMRFVLVDRARARIASKRGSGRRPATLDEALAADPTDAERVLAVHDALQVLAKLDAQLAEIVQLRFFAGLTMEEIAASLDVSRRTVQRGWQLARAWWAEEYEGAASRGADAAGS